MIPPPPIGGAVRPRPCSTSIRAPPRSVSRPARCRRPAEVKPSLPRRFGPRGADEREELVVQALAVRDERPVRGVLVPHERAFWHNLRPPPGRDLDRHERVLAAVHD